MSDDLRNIVSANPYTPFEPAYKFFVGRKSFQEAFRRRLSMAKQEQRDQRHVLISGISGIGKSSLMQRLRSLAQREWPNAFIIDFDCQHYVDDVDGAISDLEDFLPKVGDIPKKVLTWLSLPEDSSNSSYFRAVGQEVLNRLSVGLPFAMVSLSKSVSREIKHPSIFRRTQALCARIAACAANQHKPVLFFMDHIDALSDNHRFITLFNGLLSTLESLVSFRASAALFVGCIRPEQRGVLEYNCARPIFQSEHFCVFYVDKFDSEEAKEALALPLREHNIAFSQESLNKVVNAVGHLHPYYLQIAGWHLYNYLLEHQLCECKDEISLDELTIHEILAKSQARLFISFSPEEQEIIKQLAMSFPTPQTSFQLSEIFNLKHQSSLAQKAEERLEGLSRHRVRPVTKLSSGKFLLTHELFATYILDNQCQPEELAVNVVQTLLGTALRAYHITGTMLDSRLLGSIFIFKDKLTFSKEAIEAIVVSLLALDDSDIDNHKGIVEYLGKQTLCVLADFAFLLTGKLESSKLTQYKKYLNTLHNGNQNNLAENLIHLVQLVGTSSGESICTLFLSTKNNDIHKKADHLDVRISSDSSIREKVLRVLGEIGTDKSITSIWELHNDESKEIRLAAVSALNDIGSPQAQRALLDFVKDTEYNVSKKACYAIMNIGGGSVNGDLVTLIKCACHRLRFLLILALGKLEPTADSLKAIRGFAVCKNTKLSTAALISLGNLSRPEDLPILIKATKSRNQDKAIAAIEALSSYVSPESVKALLQRLGSTNFAVRSKAFAVLSEHMSLISPRFVLSWMSKQPAQLRNVGAALLGINGGAKLYHLAGG